MSTQYIQKIDCEVTELDGEWILLNSNQFTITKLNHLGGFCWSLLKEIQTVESLTNAVLAKFAPTQSENQVKQDIEDYLDNLIQCGLIEHVG
ncbi:MULTISPECIES: PqqD family protein [Bacillaceae]|uniref:PqqD family protein n=1 Tax=Bacillaceae TaxID=186817 RepID=UPI002FFF396C